MTLPFVCKEEDDFTFEQPRWIAHLASGDKVLQDDGRPGVEPAQAWLRLKDYCRQTGDYLINLTLQFRTHHEAPLPAYAEGYFFCNKIITFMQGPSIGFHLIGFVSEGQVFVQHWRVPEYIFFGGDIRTIDGNEYYLIRRQNELVGPSS